MTAAEITAEFERIESNVSGALSAIAKKGVTVPAGSGSDDLSALIESIPVGGGTEIEKCSVTVKSSGIFIIQYGGNTVKYTNGDLKPSTSTAITSSNIQSGISLTVAKGTIVFPTFYAPKWSVSGGVTNVSASTDGYCAFSVEGDGQIICSLQ